MIATTDKAKGNLIKIAQREEGLKNLCDSGWRRRPVLEMTPVGLLGAAVCGIDIKELIAGARYMDGFAAKRKCHGKYGVSGWRLAVSVYGKWDQRIRHDALCRFSQIYVGLVCAAWASRLAKILLETANRCM